MATAFGANDVAKKIKTVPLSNNSIGRKRQDITNDLHQQLKSSMSSKLFVLQVDEVTDIFQFVMIQLREY